LFFVARALAMDSPPLLEPFDLESTMEDQNLAGQSNQPNQVVSSPAAGLSQWVK
jgi:hypothetical protein